MTSHLTPQQCQLMLELNERLANTPHGHTAPLYEKTAQLLGVSSGTVRRWRHDMGLTKPRAPDPRKGKSKVLSVEQIRFASGTAYASGNNKGQRMPMSLNLEILQANGLLPPVSVSTLHRQLRHHRLHPEQLSMPTPSIQMASNGPGDHGQSDSTTGAYYYMPGGRMRWMSEDEFYMGKVKNIVRASTDLLTRYCYVDHSSGAFKARHYLGGETAENLLDFLCWAFWKQEGSPMRGVPRTLMMDPGAANKSNVVRNFCDRLSVRLMHHAPGAARVTGAVEKTHDLVRMYFETRLRFQDPREVTLDWLNTKLDEWSLAFQSTHTHSRHGKTRFSAWMEIKPDYLREAASLEALREAATRQPETRKVSNTMTVPYGGRTYDVSTVPGAIAGLKITIAQNPFRAPAIDVKVYDPNDAADLWQVVEPMKVDEWGFREGAPLIGETMRTARFSDVDHNRNAQLRDAYQRPGEGLPTIEEAAKARKRHEQAYAGRFDAFADVKATQVPTYMPRRGTELELPGSAIAPSILTIEAACSRLRAALGTGYGVHVYNWVSARFPEGVPEDQLQAIATQFAAPAAPAEQPGGLRVVGGGQ